MASVSVSRICSADFETVSTRLADPDIFGSVVDGAIHAHLEWHANGTVVSVPVTVELGQLERAPDSVSIASIPIEVHADEHERLFPTFGGTIEAVGGKVHTEVALVGRYRPPAGILGMALDATALHGVAEATLVRYLDVITRNLEQPATTPSCVSESQSPA